MADNPEDSELDIPTKPIQNQDEMDPHSEIPVSVTMSSFAIESGELREPTLLSERLPDKPTVPVPPLVDQPTTGNILDGRYELLDLVASGGMGKIYRGRHVELRTPIAVKVMHSFVASSEEHIERFRREARAASRLNHPNVVRVLDFGQVADTFYIVMEFIDGINLGDWLEKHTFPPLLSDVLPMLLQVLDALAQAHTLGIVHRDLKPDNIILTTDVNGLLWSKVVDFGLARFQEPLENDQTLTRADAVAGTPGYMSPEQCRSLNVSASTDLYAFGCILTEILQLTPPFSGDSAIDVISKHMFAPVLPLRRPEDAEPVPPLLERLRLDLLAKMPSQRPSNAHVARQRLLDAFNPQTSAAAFPPRKTGDATGKRSERVPTWNQDTITVNNFVPPGIRPVFKLSTAATATGIDEDCVMGLVSQGFHLVDALPPEQLSAALIVIDGGTVVEDSMTLLERSRASWPDAKIVMCMAEPTVELLNRVIESGADDVVRYPVSADTLGRKLERLSRRLRS